MALLQLSEPGESPLPHQTRATPKTAIGIDLGTTHSLVAVVRDETPECLSDAQGRVLLPSIVRYRAEGSVEVGVAARDAQLIDPHNVLASTKRLMGRGLDDVPLELYKQYNFANQKEGLVRINTAAGAKSPVEVAAEILRVLRERAQQKLGVTFEENFAGAVITVPAYFDEAQRQATKDAARLAGIKVLRLLSEPTAAAIAYGLDKRVEGVFVVFDLGGGTFDFSVLHLRQGMFEVLATSGDAALGGDDFDQVIADWFVKTLDLQQLNAADYRAVLIAARAAKEALSTQQEIEMRVVLQQQEAVIKLTRAVFEELSSPLLARTLAPVRKALRDAQLEVAKIDGVVLVGGATRMPQVRAAVAKFFAQEPLSSIDPDKVVALGAALQANVLAGNRRRDEDWFLLDVIPLSLGLEMMGGLVEKIIPRNSTIPIAKAQEFTTYKDGQTAMALHVVQGERDLATDCRSLARFELRGIPPMVAGAARIEVTFQVDADGLLEVSAREHTSGVAASVSVQPSYGLSDAEIAQMLQAGFAHANEDMQTRRLREAQVEAQALIDATENALANDFALLNQTECNDLKHALHALQAQISAQDVSLIRKLAAELAQHSDLLAARRMDKSIREALAGKKIDELKISEG